MTHDKADSGIVKLVRDGASANFQQLVDRYFSSLTRQACRVVHDAHLAEDLAQEALILSFIRLGQLEDPDKYGAWLRGILKNVCRMSQRSSASRPIPLPLSPADLANLTDQTRVAPDAALSRLALREAVQLLCLSLPQPLRTTSYLFYVDGLKCEEISQALGVAAATVESRLFKARAHVRKWLISHGGTREQRFLSARLLQFAREEFDMDALRLEISAELIPLVQRPEPERNLLQLIKDLRHELETGRSAHIPRIHVIDNLKLPARSFCVYLHEQSVASGTLGQNEDMTPLSDTLRRVILENQDAMSTSL